jgi:hypothetical protein
MAHPTQVKKYLAYWFQLGKKVILPHSHGDFLPEPIFQDGTYSPQFEACWQQLQSAQEPDAYLEGTVYTIAELLTPQWEISPCARCEMPVPTITLGLPPVSCPCSDLPGWPNTELPSPRVAVNTHYQLTAIRDRLLKTTRQDNSPQEPTH